MNRKVNMLMPSIYSKNHDSFIENFLNAYTPDMRIIANDKLLFGKSRSNYIFPLFLTIKVFLLF